VARRTAAPQIIVIHGGQVIVHQGIDVHHLDGAGGGLNLILG